eukprot:TRINITY_DN12391_c0_g1_i1.p1 TRINITY_DN12391_c0_g1~~TRINITY_DN12391_c0_g1_i1.p1  ORF type:complete len:460 (-),score=52.40 TRINITY_DN12391_c0_g1_i1:281-1660(-)
MRAPLTKHVREIVRLLLKWSRHRRRVMLLLVSAWLAHYLAGVRRVILHFGRGANPGSSKAVRSSYLRVKRIVAHSPSLSSIYWPTWYAYTANMQVVLLAFKEMRARIFMATPYEREIFTLSDGCRIALDWIAPQTSHEKLPGHAGPEEAPEELPVCVMQHGAFQDSASSTMIDLGIALARRGLPVVVMNRRGYGGLDLGGEHSAKVDMFGFDSDVDEVLARAVTARYPGRCVANIGFSCGSGVAARFNSLRSGELSAWTGLGKGHSCKRGGLPRLLCSVLYDPGWDLSWDGAVSRIRFPYSWAINFNIKYCYAFRHREQLRMKSSSFSDNVAAMLNPAKGLRETYRHAAKLSGIKGSTAWLNERQPAVEAMQVPTLSINSRDDPICVWENVENFKIDIGANPNVVSAELQRGSHGCKYDFWGLESITERLVGDFIIGAWRELCAEQKQAGADGGIPQQQ